MRIYRNLYWEIISPANLFYAWDVFKKDKRHKPDVGAFELDLEENIFSLYRDLRRGTYKHGAYKGFWIYDPKLRKIHKAAVRDRVLHHAIFKVLNPIFEPTFIPTSFSCRIGKGTHKGMRAVRDMIRAASENNTKPCYVLKCDVKKFFDSVDHDILLDVLHQRIKDEKAMSLLREVVESYAASRPNLWERRGVPIGNLTSQIFANIYMNELDQFVKHVLRVKYYARYTDDFVIVSRDRKYVESVLRPIQEFLKERLHLELHPNKITIAKHHRGVDFLGYVLLPKHVRLRTKTRRRMVRKLNRSIKRFKRGELGEAELDASLQSYLGVLSHANAYDFSMNLTNYVWFMKNS